MTGGESDAWSRGQVSYIYRTQRYHLLLGHRRGRRLARRVFGGKARGNIEQEKERKKGK